MSARSLCNPTAAIVAGGHLWIADTGNNRVLEFDSPWLTWDYANQRYTIKRDADRVFGQSDFTSNDCNLGAAGLCGPRGVAFDARSNLYISDSGNNRIVYHMNPLADGTAERVYGQTDFNNRDCTPEAGGAGAVCDPRGIAVISHVDAWGIDQGDDLYVADRGNNRVLLYVDTLTKATGAAAAAVFGQGGNMDTGGCAQGADGLCHPTGVSIDRGGNLLVADTDNNRVLEYESPLTDTKANRVFGQTNFLDSSCNAGGASPTAETLCVPSSVATSAGYEGNALIADTGNNRILRYQAPYCIESFSLTAANRRTKTLRSQPKSTKLKIKYGSNPAVADDLLELSDKLVLLENDGSIYENDPPLFTLATDPSFSSGAVFREEVPSWISNIRSTASGGTWSTGELELSRGITFYQIKTSFYMPSGFSDEPQRNRITYKARAVGLDLSTFVAPRAWLRGQFGSTCFTTELACSARATGAKCSPAR